MKINSSFIEFKKNYSKKIIKFYLDQIHANIITKLKIYLGFYSPKKIALSLSLLKKDLLEVDIQL